MSVKENGFPPVTWKLKYIAALLSGKDERRSRQFCKVSESTVNRECDVDPQFKQDIEQAKMDHARSQWRSLEIFEIYQGIFAIANAHKDNPKNARDSTLKAWIWLGKLLHPQEFSRPPTHHHHTHDVTGKVSIEHEIRALRQEVLSHGSYLDEIRSEPVPEADANPRSVRSLGIEGGVDAGEASGDS